MSDGEDFFGFWSLNSSNGIADVDDIPNPSHTDAVATIHALLDNPIPARAARDAIDSHPTLDEFAGETPATEFRFTKNPPLQLQPKNGHRSSKTKSMKLPSKPSKSFLGISDLVYFFTKLMMPIKVYLHSHGIAAFIYIDDCLILGHSKADCEQKLNFARQTWKIAGWIENREKAMEPRQIGTFLSLTINLREQKFYLPAKKILHIARLIDVILAQESIHNILLDMSTHQTIKNFTATYCPLSSPWSSARPMVAFTSLLAPLF
eukprot:TCALIF_12787-PA protein Name:"Protein of unknown function" AED:0.40 eAED:0.40 QI:7/0.5/0/0.66/0/0.33/3/0/262